MQPQPKPKNNMLTRSLSATNMLTTDNNRFTNKVVKDYTLDKSKALEKKQLCCSKEHMKSEMKPGKNLVIQFSAAAYELCKSCLGKILYSDNFLFSVEKREGIDQEGSVVDICYKVFNTKADGSCGKLQKFVINCYHTSSQMLVNGSKIELFLTEIYEQLCNEMKAKCSQLDIMNINISEIIDSMNLEKQSIPASNLKAIELSQSLPENVNQEQVDNINDSINDACELCPICQEQAFGKAVQCGTCGEWYHYDCLNIDDTAIDTLGEDDFVCRLCSEDLLYASGNENLASHNEQLNSSQNVETHNRSGISTKINYTPMNSANPDSDRLYTPVGSPNTNCKVILTPVSGHNTGVNDENCNSEKYIVNTNIGNNDSYIHEASKDNGSKSKPKCQKKVTKPKLRKEEVAEKTYVLELESELKQLRSTIELYKRVAESKDNKVTHSESHINATTVTNENQTCSHRCCAELSEKMQENRIRLLETQMQQNLYINNSMHIQLVAQMQQCQAAMQQKFVESPYPTNHIYPHGNQGNWYGMPPVGHTPPPLPFPHIPPPHTVKRYTNRVNIRHILVIYPRTRSGCLYIHINM